MPRPMFFLPISLQRCSARMCGLSHPTIRRTVPPLRPLQLVLLATTFASPGVSPVRSAALGSLSPRSLLTASTSALTYRPSLIPMQVRRAAALARKSNGAAWSTRGGRIFVRVGLSLEADVACSSLRLRQESFLRCPAEVTGEWSRCMGCRRTREPGGVFAWRTYPGVVYKGLFDLMVRSSFPVPRRDLDCARRILPCAEAPLRRDLSRPDSRLARRLRGTSPSCAQPQRSVRAGNRNEAPSTAAHGRSEAPALEVSRYVDYRRARPQRSVRATNRADAPSAVTRNRAKRKPPRYTSRLCIEHHRTRGRSDASALEVEPGCVETKRTPPLPHSTALARIRRSEASAAARAASRPRGVVEAK